MKKKGIALISTIVIVSILVMIMVSMVFILTNSTFMTGRYIDNNSAMQVAEAGIAYALSQMNKNPDWTGDINDEDGSGYKYSKVSLPEVGGNFYITFNPAKDYCSYNNLRKGIEATRSLKPSGNIPPFTAEVIVRGEANKRVKYVRAVMMRGDFTNSNVSAEGPYVIKNATGYEDTGISDDTKGLIISNTSKDPSVAIPTTVPVNLYGGKVVSCGKAKIENYDPNNTKIVDNSSKQDFGRIPIAKILSQRPQNPDVISEVSPGVYTVKRELRSDGYYDYRMECNGVAYDCSAWAEFDSWGNMIIKKSIYVPQNGSTPLTIEFEYSNETYNLTGMKDRDEDIADIPLIVKIMDIPAAYATDMNGPGSTTGTGPGGNPTPVRTKYPTVTPVPATPTPLPLNGNGGEPTGTIGPLPTATAGISTPVPTAQGGGVVPTPTEVSTELAPKIIFDTREGKHRIIYSNADIDLRGRLNGIGAVVTTGKTSIIGDRGSFTVLSSDDIVIHMDPYNNFDSTGYIYSDDDIYIIETESSRAIKGRSSNQPVGLPPSSSSLYDPVQSIDMDYVNNGEWKFGGIINSHNCNAEDVNPYNPSDSSCSYFDIPKKKISFGKYINYTDLDLIEGYEFPVKLKCWQELH